MSNLLFFDLETAGTDSEKYPILQIAAKRHGTSDVFEESCTGNVDMENKVDLGALKYNHISINRIFNEDVPEKKVLIKFCRFLLEMKNKKRFKLCGQNIHFDYYYLKKRLEIHGIDGMEALIDYRMKDLYTLSSTVIEDLKLLKTDNDSTSLNEVAKALKIKVNDASLHTAGYDVKLSEKVHDGLMFLLGDVPWQE